MKNKEKGDQYEVYIKKFVKKEYDYVYLWNDVPKKILEKIGLNENHKKDIGVDLVAVKDDKLLFIQCKNYSSGNTIAVEDLAGFYFFVSEYGSRLTDKYIVFYNGKLSGHVKQYRKRIDYINVKYENKESISTFNNCIYKPRLYQFEAYNKLKKCKRSVLQLPCGMGKTYVSFLISKKHKNIVIIAPSRASSEQNLDNYEKFFGSDSKNRKFILISSDGERNNVKSDVSNVLSSTYKSCDVVLKQLKKLDDVFIIIDECHNISESDTKGETNLGKIINSNCKILFLSATPKLDNPKIFGADKYTYTWSDAIKNKFICDNKIYYLKNNKSVFDVKIGSDSLKIKGILTKAYSILKILEENNNKKCIIYLKTIELSDKMQNAINLLKGVINKSIGIYHINSNMSKKDRTGAIKNFTTNNKELSIICNVRVLDEAIDIASCDSVFLSNPTFKPIKIIQRICRCNRIDKNNKNKISSIYLWASSEDKLSQINNLIKNVFNNNCSIIDVCKKINSKSNSDTSLMYNNLSPKKLNTDLLSNLSDSSIIYDNLLKNPDSKYLDMSDNENMCNELKIKKISLEKSMMGDQNDQAHYFSSEHKSQIKIGYTDKKKASVEIYFFDKKKKLYELKTDSSMITYLCEFLKKQYIKARDIIKKIDDIEEKKKKIYIKNESKIGDFMYCTKVWKFAKEILLNNTSSKFFEEQLNKNPDYLPIKNNKIINLETGKVRDRNNEDYFTFECNVNYLEDNDKLKHARKYISSICSDDKEYSSYLIRIMGYCLTGRNESRCFFQLCGEGSNGKSGLFDIFSKILGDPFYDSINHGTISKEQSKKTGSGATEHLIPLKNSRVVVMSELEKNFEFASGTLKSITGGDKVIMRSNYGSQLSIKVQCKVMIMTNNPIKFDTSDKAFIKRLRHLLFFRKFVNVVKNKKNEVKSDTEFLKKMETTYLDELFTLFVKEGSVKWYKRLRNKKQIDFEDYPKILEKGIAEYFKDNDPVGIFIEEKLEKKEGGKVYFVEVFDSYKVWCKEGNRSNNLTKETFGKEMKSKGYNSELITINKKNKKGKPGTGYKELSLKNDDDTSDLGDSFDSDKKDSSKILKIFKKNKKEESDEESDKDSDEESDKDSDESVSHSNNSSRTKKKKKDSDNKKLSKTKKSKKKKLEDSSDEYSE